MPKRTRKSPLENLERFKVKNGILRVRFTNHIHKTPRTAGLIGLNSLSAGNGRLNGGGSRIRTYVSEEAELQSAAINHSTIPPRS